MLRVHLTGPGLNDAHDRLRRLVSRKLGDDDAAAVAILIASLPDKTGVWSVPPEAEGSLRRLLYASPDIARAVKLSNILQRRASAEYLNRVDRARKLFNEWVGATNPDILASVWYNLNQEDRHHWLALADQQINEEGEQ